MNWDAENKKDPMELITKMFPPWYWWIFLWLILIWPTDILLSHLILVHDSTHSSNSFPLWPIISHDESLVLSYCHPFLFLWLLFLCCFIIFPMAALLCLLRLHVMTHFLTHTILHAGRIFWQRHNNRIVCLVNESAMHVYKGQFSPWFGQFTIQTFTRILILQEYSYNKIHQLSFWHCIV